MLKDEEFDGSPEAKWREERLRQCLIVYQALMAYLLSIWDETKTVEDVEKLLSLFRTHSSFVEFAKVFFYFLTNIKSFSYSPLIREGSIIGQKV